MQNDTLYEQMSTNFNNLAPICFLYERDTEKSNRISNALRSKFLTSSRSETALSVTGLNHVCNQWPRKKLKE